MSFPLSKGGGGRSPSLCVTSIHNVHQELVSIELLTVHVLRYDTYYRNIHVCHTQSTKVSNWFIGNVK